MRLSKKRVGVYLCFLLVGGFLSVSFLLREVKAKDSDDSSLFQQLKIFTDVISIVQRDYVREIDSKKLVEGAIKGMLATLDPHSGYLDPDFYQDLQVQTKGEFGGLGLEITIKDGLLIVVAPMEGSPAEQAGIRAGDSIIKIEGKYTKEFSLVDAVKKLRGPRGTPITLSIYRKGSAKLVDVTVVRDNITVKSVRSRYLEDNFGYVRISQFMEKTGDDLKTALKKLEQSTKDGEIKGLILDLRNNPGGLLTQAIRVSDMFLTEGVIVYTDGRVENQKQKFYAHARGTEPEYPIIVLVNNGSASASEIVAGALKDHGRALILGTQTFGKGSVQTITPLDNGGALTLTTALYYTKSGNSIQLTGVKPDIEMDITGASETAASTEAQQAPGYREEDLPGAIDNPSLNGQKPSRGTKEEQAAPSKTELDLPLMPEKMELKEWLSKDLQLARALELLKTFNIFHAGGAQSVAADNLARPLPETSQTQGLATP